MGRTSASLVISYDKRFTVHPEFCDTYIHETEGSKIYTQSHNMRIICIQYSIHKPKTLPLGNSSGIPPDNFPIHPVVSIDSVYTC